MARPLAVVTGASSGIGRALAHRFATEGFDVLVTAQDDAIEDAAAAVRLATPAARVDAVRADLATGAGVEALATGIAEDGRDVDALALNAGVAAGGVFHDDVALADALAVVDLNCRSTVHLAKRVLPGMVDRGAGRVLVVSSTVATTPGPGNAVYNASKSFTQAFGLALREELRDSGVTVTLLMPGRTDTPVWERSDLEGSIVGAAGGKDDPDDVARRAVEGLLDGEDRVIGAGLGSRLEGRIGRLAPESVKAEVHGRLAKDRSG